MPMDDSTRESLASAIEHPCAPCVYGDHAGCLAPIGDEGNCCCDELDGWAPGPRSRSTMPPTRREALRKLAARRQR